MVCQYRVAKMFRRSGRFLLPGGASATKGGDLALPCRACPDPLRNLPKNWKDNKDFRSLLSFASQSHPNTLQTDGFILSMSRWTAISNRTTSSGGAVGVTHLC
jgi:hypothetical protein